jgi:hypothetical protein
VNEKHKRPTATAHLFLTCLLALTRQYRRLPELRHQLKGLQRTLPKPPPVYQKNDAWVSRGELARIGALLWPRKLPNAVRGNGRLHAFRAGLSLMLRLWCYIPYRQRNIREMTLDHNLYKTTNGQWRLRFTGDQLKMAAKRGRPNAFDLPFPDTLVPALESYLELWRPLLVTGPASPARQVFLMRTGHPFSSSQLRATTRRIIYGYTGKQWHPHILRSVWATEEIRETGDLYAAAVMLNNTFETIVKNYAHLREENIAEAIYRRLDARDRRPPNVAAYSTASHP